MELGESGFNDALKSHLMEALEKTLESFARKRRRRLTKIGVALVIIALAIPQPSWHACLTHPYILLCGTIALALARYAFVKTRTRILVRKIDTTLACEMRNKFGRKGTIEVKTKD